MPGNSTIDVRDQRDGGWSWVQNDIYTVFLPIIGREATHLYQVMTYLIPERMRNPIFNLTIRKISEVAGMSKSTVHRELKVLHRVGLMPQVSSDPPVFVLADLRKLAKLGTEELKSRLVPHRDKDEGMDGGGGMPEPGEDEPQTPAGNADAHHNGSNHQQAGATAPAASGGDVVPHRDKGEKQGKKAVSAESLSQKRGGLVPQEGHLVPEKGGVCPTAEGQLYKELSRHLEEKPKPPPPPVLLAGISAKMAGLGVVDSQASRRILNDCRQANPDVTGEEILFWLDYLADRAQRPGSGIREPGAYAIRMVGDCVAGGQYEQLKAGAEQQRTAEQARAADTPTFAWEAYQPVAPALAETTWHAVAKVLETKMPHPSFETWIKPARGMDVIAGKLYVRVPTPEFLHIGERWGELIEEAIVQQGLKVTDLHFVATPEELPWEFRFGTPAPGDDNA